MLRVSEAVPRWLVVLAACACARRGASAIDGDARLLANSTLDLAERAPRERDGPGENSLLWEIGYVSGACYGQFEVSPRGSSRREALYAVCNAAFAASNLLSGGPGDSIAEQAMNAAAAAAWALAIGRDDEALSDGPLPVEVIEQRRELASDVRRFLSLGTVLRSLLV